MLSGRRDPMRAYRKVDDGYQFRIEGGRLALLGVGAGLVLLLVFLLGILIGRQQGRVPLSETGREAAPPMAVGPVSEPEVAPAPLPVAATDLQFYEELKKPDAGPLPAEPTIAPRSLAAPVEGPDVAEGPGSPPVARPSLEVAAPPAPAPVAAPAPGAPVFTVQVGSFHDRAAAEDLAKRVGAPGLQVQVVVSVVSGRTWYRVQAGRFDTRAAAEAHYRDRLRSRGIEGFVTTR